MPEIMNIFTCFYTQPSCIHNTEVHSTCMILYSMHKMHPFLTTMKTRRTLEYIKIMNFKLFYGNLKLI